MIRPAATKTALNDLAAKPSVGQRLKREFAIYSVVVVSIFGLACVFDGWREGSNFALGSGAGTRWLDRLPFWTSLGLSLILTTAWLFHRLTVLLSRHNMWPEWIDPLTELPNLYLLEDRLQRATKEAGRDGRRVVLILVDLERFRRVNEAFGRALGDQVLQRIARRIQGLLRDTDTLARVNGDQFAVAARVDEPDQAELIAGKILAALSKPCTLLGSDVAIDANIGMAFFPDHGRDTRTLLQHAEFALDLAAESGERRAVYAPERDVATPDRLALLAGLPAALRSGQLYLVFQSKQDVRGSIGHRYEALVRWQHPDHGELDPGQFLPLIEQTGAIVQLTHWAIREVLRLTKTSAQIPTGLEIAVNLSARLLDDANFPHWMEQQLQHYNVSPRKIRFEVTESAVMNDSVRALQVLEGLASMGMAISVDDFGVGHSSLAYLARLPVDELKIDKSFVTHLAERKPDRAIVKATIGLAHDLGLRVVAEGVESDQQVALLTEFGCDTLQGHWVAKPVRGDDLLASWAA